MLATSLGPVAVTRRWPSRGFPPWLEMPYVLAGVRINEAVFVFRTPTCELFRKCSEAFEAKASATITAEHLVAFCTLRRLTFQVLLGDCTFATWTLLCSRLPHPLHKTTPTLLLQSRSVLLARPAPVVGLSTTTQTRPFLAFRALELGRCTGLQGYSHWTVGCRARSQVLSGGYGLLQATGKQSFHQFWRNHALQVAFRELDVALWAGLKNSAVVQACLYVPRNALHTVPSVLTPQTDCTGGLDILTAYPTSLSGRVKSQSSGRSRSTGRTHGPSLGRGQQAATRRAGRAC